MEMTPKKIEKLKTALFMAGTGACDDFCGVPTVDMDKDAVDNLMDEVIDQMPEEEFDRFYTKYVEDPEDGMNIYCMNDLVSAYHAVDPSMQDAALMFMSELTGRSVDFLLGKVDRT